MNARVCRVIATAPQVTVPETGRPAAQVLTDNAWHAESGIYLELGSPLPDLGTVITWEGHWVSWTDATGQQVKARKVEYAFDPDATLH
ncbi:MAG TPA: hypothetical protein VKQ27_17805 [Acetobacteraceae bacterium]|nr:hypothetical protein [Acetobacteraceae bacterium]